jgi:phosphatidate phosphatase APP1
MTTLLEAMTRRPLTNLVAGDHVVLYPTLGHLSRDGANWVVDLHGDVSAPGQMTLGKRMLLRVVKRAMRASDADIDSDIFRDRIARFVARDRAGKRIAVRIGEHTFRLTKKTGRNGHFQAAVRLPLRLVEKVLESRTGHRLPDEGSDTCGGLALPIEVVGTDAASECYLLARHGVSVISDIDDTLKHSHVACKKTLLQNTFLRPFETIPGMAFLLREWSAAGAAMHYVSSSPWQLYEHLAAHLAEEGFPHGSFHLRHFRLRDHVLRRLLLMRRAGKLNMIRGIIKNFPHRNFLLVGDSGERDPEIYGAIARRFPRQVVGIFIRQLTGEKNSARRYSRAFQGVDPSLIRRFEMPEELAEIRLLKE